MKFKKIMLESSDQKIVKEISHALSLPSAERSKLFKKSTYYFPEVSLCSITGIDESNGIYMYGHYNSSLADSYLYKYNNTNYYVWMKIPKSSLPNFTVTIIIGRKDSSNSSNTTVINSESLKLHDFIKKYGVKSWPFIIENILVNKFDHINVDSDDSGYAQVKFYFKNTPYPKTFTTSTLGGAKLSLKKEVEKFLDEIESASNGQNMSKIRRQLSIDLPEIWPNVSKNCEIPQAEIQDYNAKLQEKLIIKISEKMKKINPAFAKLLYSSKLSDSHEAYNYKFIMRKDKLEISGYIGNCSSGYWSKRFEFKKPITTLNDLIKFIQSCGIIEYSLDKVGRATAAGNRFRDFYKNWTNPD